MSFNYNAAIAAAATLDVAIIGNTTPNSHVQRGLGYEMIHLLTDNRSASTAVELPTAVESVLKVYLGILHTAIVGNIINITVLNIDVKNYQDAIRTAAIPSESRYLGYAQRCISLLVNEEGVKEKANAPTLCPSNNAAIKVFLTAFVASFT